MRDNCSCYVDNNPMESEYFWYENVARALLGNSMLNDKVRRTSSRSDLFYSSFLRPQRLKNSKTNQKSSQMCSQEMHAFRTGIQLLMAGMETSMQVCQWQQSRFKYLEISQCNDDWLDFK